MSNQSPLPLTGIRVLDATHIVAGPFCSQILADMGAEVIKIERPRTGDLVRGRGPYVTKEDGQRISSRYIGLNRNKKSVTLDLRNPRCKAAFEEMVKVSDALLDNWGPGGLPPAGTGLRPPQGTEPRPYLRQHYRLRRQRRPARPLFQLASQQPGHPGHGRVDGTDRRTGATAAERGRQHRRLHPRRLVRPGRGAGPALREQTGRGQHVDMAMYECMVLHTLSNMYGYEASGELFTRDYSRLANAGMTLRASDGYVIMAGARVPERWSNLWKLVGRDDLADNPDYLAPGDGDFIVQHVIPALEEWSQHRPRWEVAGKITELGFSMGVAQNTEDLAHCPQLEARDMFVETGDTAGGTFRSLRTPIRLLDCATIEPETAPLLGQHNREVLCSLGGLTEEELAGLEEEGAV